LEKSKVIENLFYKILEYSYLLLPFSLFFIGKKGKTTIPIILAIYGIVCFCFISFYSDIPRENRKYFKTSYTFFEYAIFTFIFWKNFNAIKIRRIVVFTSILFFIFQITYLLSGKVERLDTVPIGIETILVLTYIIYFFYQYSKKVETNYIYNHYLFWICVGILIYLGGSFFFFILINHLSEEQVVTFGNLTYLAEILKNVLFFTAILVFAKSFDNKKDNSVPYLDMV
jgi:hypothetical protein